jgi:probable phosphoglycerate mutase
MRLILVRHGQTPANVDGIIESSYPGPGLTELGMRQAAAVPEALAGENVDSISVSRLVRTHLTAAPLAEALGIAPVERPGVHEIEAGDYEGRTDVESVRGYVLTAAAWGSGDLDRRMPGAGDGHDFFARFDGDVRDIERSGSSVAVVVSHGAAIRVWTAGRARNIPATFMRDHDLPNTGVAVLDGTSDDGWSLETWLGSPLGGTDLDDATAPDPTAEAASEV